MQISVSIEVGAKIGECSVAEFTLALANIGGVGCPFSSLKIDSI